VNWEAIGTIGEIVGSIAVVVSLVYVSLQIRHANKQSEIESFRHTWDGLNQFCDQVTASRETASTINRGRVSLDSLDEADYLVFEHIHLRLLNTLESWYLQLLQTSRPGPYREQQIENLAGIVGGYFGHPGTRALWRRLRPYYPTIAEIVERELFRDDDRAPVAEAGMVSD